jgi:hypothetical protein
LALSDVALIRSQDQFCWSRERAKTLVAASPYRGGGVAPGYQSLVIATVNSAPSDIGKALPAVRRGSLGRP